MKLTLQNRLKICWEVLTIKSGHSHTAQEKQLSTFQKGYDYGMEDYHCFDDISETNLSESVLIDELKNQLEKWDNNK